MGDKYLRNFKYGGIKLPLLITLLLLLARPGFSQWGGYHQFASDWEINTAIGMTSFYGDLTDKKNRFISNTPFHRYFYEDRKLGFGFTLRKNFNAYLAFRGSFNYGKISSSSSTYNRYFNAKFYEYYLGVDFDLSTLIWGKSRNQDWKLYAFTGLGFTDSRTWLYDDKTNELLSTNGFGEERWLDGKQKMATETTFPIGIGGQYKFSDSWSATIESGIHIINTDRLDAFKSSEAGIEGFGYACIGISYHFHMPWQLRLSRYPKHNGKSSDPALRKYNKRKQVVMQTRSYRKAKQYRYKNPRHKNIFDRIAGWFKPNPYKRRRR